MSVQRALAVIPQGASLVEREPQVAAWVDEQNDAQQLREARALLAAWKRHAERGSAERDAAIRLDIRCERRIGQLPEVAPKPAGRPPKSGPAVPIIPAAERRAESRARALAAIPQEVFEEKIAEPKPSREKMLAAAIIPEPTVDPALDEQIRLSRTVKGPPGTWAVSKFDPSLLDEQSVLTLRWRIEAWRKWCDEWVAALAAVPQIRRVK